MDRLQDDNSYDGPRKKKKKITDELVKKDDESLNTPVVKRESKDDLSSDETDDEDYDVSIRQTISYLQRDENSVRNYMEYEKDSALLNKLTLQQCLLGLNVLKLRSIIRKLHTEGIDTTDALCYNINEAFDSDVYWKDVRRIREDIIHLCKTLERRYQNSKKSIWQTADRLWTEAAAIKVRSDALQNIDNHIMRTAFNPLRKRGIQSFEEGKKLLDTLNDADKEKFYKAQERNRYAETFDDLVTKKHLNNKIQHA